jgi:hypothetical protein
MSGEHPVPKFIFAYHGGNTPQTPQETDQAMAAWKAWFEAMGDAVVDPGNPVGKSRTVTDKGVDDHGGTNPLSGYTVVTAAEFDDAIDLAKGCPMVLDGSGSVEVAMIHEM